MKTRVAHLMLVVARKISTEIRNCAAACDCSEWEFSRPSLWLKTQDWDTLKTSFKVSHEASSNEQRWACLAAVRFNSALAASCPIHFWFHSSGLRWLLNLLAPLVIFSLWPFRLFNFSRMGFFSKRLMPYTLSRCHSLSSSIQSYLDTRCKFTIWWIHQRSTQLPSSALCCCFFIYTLWDFFSFSFRFQFTSREDFCLILMLQAVVWRRFSRIGTEANDNFCEWLKLP